MLPLAVGAPPSIQFGELDITKSAGDILTIPPNITFGLPRATVVWSLNGQTLTSGDPRVDISSEGVLMVASVQESDGGNYTLTVSNNFGTDSSSVRVTINREYAIYNCSCIASMAQGHATIYKR